MKMLPRRKSRTGFAITFVAIVGLVLGGFAVPAAGHGGQTDPAIWSGPHSNPYQPININTVTFDGVVAPNGAGSGTVERFEFDTKNVPKEMTFDGVTYSVAMNSVVIIEHFAGNWQVSQGNMVKFQGTAHAFTQVSDNGDPTFTRTRVLIESEPTTNSVKIDIILQAAGTTVVRHEHVPATSPVPIHYLHDVSKAASNAGNVGVFTLTMEPCTFQGVAGSCTTLFNPDPTLVNYYLPVGGLKVCIKTEPTFVC